MTNVDQMPAKTGTMLDVSLIDHLKAKGAKSATKMIGPNGAFISWTDGKERHTLPVGRNSQDGKLEDFSLIQTEPDADGNSVIIATVNNYSAEETVEFN